MRKFILIAALSAISLTGCGATPVSSEHTSNGIEVQKLFTKDNCTVYKFFDGNIRSVYYADCASSVTLSQERSCGKNCTRREFTVTPKVEN